MNIDTYRLGYQTMSGSLLLPSPLREVGSFRAEWLTEKPRSRKECSIPQPTHSLSRKPSQGVRRLTELSKLCMLTLSFSHSGICMFACVHAVHVYVHMLEEAQGEVRHLPQSPFPSFSEAGSLSQTQSLWMWLVSPASLFWGSLSLLSEAGSTCSLHTHRHLHKFWGARQVL